MISFPNAKINLGLNIIEKRSDGYHNIESVFYPVPWCDVLEIIPSPNFKFNSTGLAIPGESSNNLIIKAFELLKNKGYFTDQNVNIHLHKIIPMGAGIGGGSADGAFALKMLNEIFNLNISVLELQKFAAQLGSDCAFFIENTPKFCFGKGDHFQEINLDLSSKIIVLINPQIHISTAEAFANIIPKKPKRSIKEIIYSPIDNWKNELINDFEQGIVKNHPEISKIKNQLYELGAEYASMTGTGSTVFGIFKNNIDIPEGIFTNCVISKNSN